MGEDGSSGRRAGSVITAPHSSVVDDSEAVAKTNGGEDEFPIGNALWWLLTI